MKVEKQKELLNDIMEEKVQIEERDEVGEIWRETEERTRKMPSLEEELRDPSIELEQLRDIARTFNFTGFAKHNKSELVEFLLKRIKSPEFANNDTQNLTYSMKELLKLILDNRNFINEDDLKDKYNYTDQTFNKNLNTLFQLFVIYGIERNDDSFIYIREEFLKWVKNYVANVSYSWL